MPMITPIPFDLTRKMVRGLLEQSVAFLSRTGVHDRDWSVQGFGMLRTYLDSDKRYRLNIWDSSLAIPDVSIIHDHPWHFTSWVLNKGIKNVRYYITDSSWGVLYKHLTNGGSFESFVRMHEGVPENYLPGDCYMQEANEIHATFPDDGCVTVNERVRVGGDTARVFWRANTHWVDAKPRVATNKELRNVLERTLANWATHDA